MESQILLQSHSQREFSKLWNVLRTKRLIMTNRWLCNRCRMGFVLHRQTHPIKTDETRFRHGWLYACGCLLSSPQSGRNILLMCEQITYQHSSISITLIQFVNGHAKHTMPLHFKNLSSNQFCKTIFCDWFRYKKLIVMTQKFEK